MTIQEAIEIALSALFHVENEDRHFVALQKYADEAAQAADTLQTLAAERAEMVAVLRAIVESGVYEEYDHFDMNGRDHYRCGICRQTWREGNDERHTDTCPIKAAGDLLARIEETSHE